MATPQELTQREILMQALSDAGRAGNNYQQGNEAVGFTGGNFGASSLPVPPNTPGKEFSYGFDTDLEGRPEQGQVQIPSRFQNFVNLILSRSPTGLVPATQYVEGKPQQYKRVRF